MIKAEILINPHLPEQQPMGDVLRKHEARHQVMDGSGLAAVRTEDQCVKAPLPEVEKTRVRGSSS